MKPNQTKGGNPVHQTVAEKIQFESAGQSIEIEFTDQQLSPHAGTATFWSFVHESGWREVVARKRKSEAEKGQVVHLCLHPRAEVFL